MDSLASTVVAHDNQIEALIHVAEKHNQGLEKQKRAMAEVCEVVAATERQWQANINTLPRQ